jgi:hypothetical protein
MDARIRDAERDELAAWFAWDGEYPDEGALLLLVPASDGHEEIKSAATALLGYATAAEDKHDEARDKGEAAGWIATRKSWSFEGGTLTTWDENGLVVERRQPTEIELDLLEELTHYRQKFLTAACPDRLEIGPHRWTPGAPGSPDWCYFCEKERSVLHAPEPDASVAGESK